MNEAYERVKKDVEEAAASSEELGELIREMMIKTYGPAKAVRYYNVQLETHDEERMDRTYHQFRSIVLARVYEALAQECRECLTTTS